MLRNYVKQYTVKLLCNLLWSTDCLTFPPFSVFIYSFFWNYFSRRGWCLFILCQRLFLTCNWPCLTKQFCNWYHSNLEKYELQGMITNLPVSQLANHVINTHEKVVSDLCITLRHPGGEKSQYKILRWKCYHLSHFATQLINTMYYYWLNMLAHP